MAQIWSKILRKRKDQKDFVNEKYVMSIFKKDFRSFVDRVQLLMAYGIMLEGDTEKAQFLNSWFTAMILLKKQNLHNGKDRCNMVKRQGTQPQNKTN